MLHNTTTYTENAQISLMKFQVLRKQIKFFPSYMFISSHYLEVISLRKEPWYKYAITIPK